MHEHIDYFEHDADMGIVGRGTRIEEAFENAATAVFAIMTDLRQVAPRETVEIKFEEADAELAPVPWLNLLLGQARSHSLIFGRFQLHRDGASPKVGDRRSGPPEEVGTFPSGGIETSGARWSGTAEGEPWRAGLQRGVEVKGATRAFGPGHPALPECYRGVGQPVIIGGSMGTGSWILAGNPEEQNGAFASASHGAGRAMSRHQALRQRNGRELIHELAVNGILIRTRSMRGAAEEAPGAYKDVDLVAEATEQAGLARRVAVLRPKACVKG